MTIDNIININIKNDWKTKEEELEKEGRFYERYNGYKDGEESFSTETTYLPQSVFERK